MRAVEIDPPVDPGYEFSAWSSSLGEALGKLRAKIRAGLARRHLAEHPERGLQMLTDALAGQVASGGIIIDGRHVPFAWLVAELQALEGAWIEIRTSDPSE